MAPTGVKAWSSDKGEVTKMSFSPLPAGDYKLKVKRGWEIRKSDNANSSQLRYANGSFEVLDSAQKEGGKNRKVFHSFYVDLTPGSDGVVMPDRSGQLKDFARAVGQTISPPIIEQLKNNPKDGSKKKVQTLSPKAIVEFMNNLDGEVVEAHIKVEKDQNGNPQNRVEFFVEAEGSDEESNDEGSEDEESELDGDESEGELEEDGESEDEDESAEDGEGDDEEGEEDEDEGGSDLEEVEEDAPRAHGKLKPGAKKGKPAKAGKKGKKK